MLAENPVPASAVYPIGKDELPAGHKRLRAAIVADFLEEKWPSMDFVADMLTEHLQALESGAVCVARWRPAMTRRFSRLPVLGNHSPLHNADRFLNRFLDYPRWLRRRRNDADVFHIVDHSYSHLIFALPRNRTVVTCHDLDTFRCLLEPDQEPRPRWFRAMSQRILDGFRQAAHVIAVSHATRNQVLRYGLLPPERITVIPDGVHPACSPDRDPPADAAAARLMPDPDGRVRWLLSVGSTIRRKRLDVLLRVFAAVRRRAPEVRLARVGGLNADHLNLARELQIEDAIVNLPFLERDHLAAVYRRSALLLHTADAEGFGLPLIEAMACGCPVVASDIPVLREVGGAAACYCPVADIEAWQRATTRLLEERAHRATAWVARRQASIARAACFTWAENIRQTVVVYRRVVLNAGCNSA